MPDSMIERVGRDVAAEMARQADAVRDPDTGQWNVTCSGTISFDAGLIARAAVEALRQTTEAMREASYSRERKMGFVGNLAPRGMNHSAVWETMVDVILAEGQSAGAAPARSDLNDATSLDREARAIFRVLWGHGFGAVAVYERDEEMWRDAALEVRKVRAAAAGAAPAGEGGHG